MRQSAVYNINGQVGSARVQQQGPAVQVQGEGGDTLSWYGR